MLHPIEPLAHHVAEVKDDGHLVMSSGGQLHNRPRNDVTHRCPEIATVADAVLIDALIPPQDAGLRDFHAMQRRMTDDESKIVVAVSIRPAPFKALDIIERKDQTLAHLPLRQCRVCLEAFDAARPHLLAAGRHSLVKRCLCPA